MHDPWLDRLSEYLDNDLGAEDRRQLEEHLAACDVCRTTLAELRTVLVAARSLENTAPAHDLWPNIAAAITARETRAVVPIAAARSRRRVSFTMPQLAAAAILMMGMSATAVWLLMSPPSAVEPISGTIVHSAGDGPARTQFVGTPAVENPAFDSTVAQLERTLIENRAQLDPATVEVLERSLASIDRAIAESRTALAADPANPHLHRQLESTMQKKIDVLRRATRIRRVGT